ncbi:MAG: glycoside hydrolase family 13 protein [Oscillospiraceae bacterium]|jgi:glycosidase|nr:glycoside hydrolase family 13 protein [Oscillospiraceae bacterium]
MRFVPFRSRSPLHKAPFGAVAAGEEIALRVVLPRQMRCRGVALRWGDFDGAWEGSLPFWWEGMEGEGEEWWQCRLTLREPGLYRYRFACESEFGGGVIGDGGQGVGGVGEEAWFRLTIYDPALRLPGWAPGGVLYQIFPDRFCSSGSPKHGVPEDRALRRDWDGAPHWNPDERGKITRYDFFGGDFAGIAGKLGYLKSLGVTCVYLNPIFLARSNHRYDTSDYFQVDPLLGDEEGFRSLCSAAHELGIRILLDGVFSHTGDDSAYFRQARASKDSPYYEWYTFRHWPDDYACWWGIDILPELREDHPAVLEFFTGEGGVARHWLRMGADGWRIDVADELPDVFLDRLYEASVNEKPEAYLLGEVWEDASRKWSHGGRRRFLLGGQMHSVMNYPLADAILRFAREAEAEQLAGVIESQLEHYPPCAVAGLMNHIGTHDTPRALTRLLAGGAPERARRKLMLCAALQYTLPGNPCVYYGDEAGLRGAEDPFNRACYPWGREDGGLLARYRALGALRSSHREAFAGIGFRLLSAALGCIAYLRGNIAVIANANPHAIVYELPAELHGAKALLGSEVRDGGVEIEAESAAVLMANA